MTTFLTTDDVAARWKTTPHAIWHMRSKGLLPPAVRIGRRLLWDESDIAAFELDRRENQPVRDRSTPGPKPVAWPAKRDYSSWGKTA